MELAVDSFLPNYPMLQRSLAANRSTILPPRRSAAKLWLQCIRDQWRDGHGLGGQAVKHAMSKLSALYLPEKPCLMSIEMICRKAMV